MQRQNDEDMPAAELPSLYVEHHQDLVRYLLRRTKQWDLAEDLAQETWMRALTRGHQYRGEVPYGHWLRSIARNLHIDWVRHSAILRLQSLEPDLEGEIPPLPPDLQPSALQQLLSAEKSAYISLCLRRLDPDAQTLILEKFYREIPLREVAAKYALNVASTKSKIYRNLKSLRKPLQGYFASDSWKN